MARYTFDTSNLEEAALTARRLKVNADEGGSYADNAAFVEAAVRTKLLRPMVDGFVEQRLHQVADAYRAASPAQRAQAEAALGL